MDILKGNDFTIVWEINKGIATNPEDFTSSKVIVFLGNMHDKQAISHTISGNTITIPVFGNKLGCGTYNIEAIWSKNQDRNWARVKKTSIFTITDNPNIVDPSLTKIKIDSIAIAIGYDGLSAYELAVNKGYIGSEDDWLEGQSFANPVDNLTSTSSIDYLVANQGRVLHEKMKGINFEKATDGYTYPFKQLGVIKAQDVDVTLDELKGYSHRGNYRFMIGNFNHDLKIYSNAGAVFQELTGTILLNTDGTLNSDMFDMNNLSRFWRVYKDGWSKWNDYRNCSLASQLITFDGVIDSVMVQIASYGGYNGKILYVKNKSMGISIIGTTAIPGKQFVMEVGDDSGGKPKYYTNWHGRVKHSDNKSKPYPSDIYVCGDTMYRWKNDESGLVPFTNENQYIEFAAEMDVATIESMGVSEDARADNVYYVHDARVQGSINGGPGFVLKSGTGIKAKYYDVFPNKHLWSGQDGMPYRNKFYREANGSLYTFEPSISGHLRPTFPVRRSEFDNLVRRVESIEGTGIELTPEMLIWAVKESESKTLTVKTMLDWQAKIEEQK